MNAQRVPSACYRDSGLHVQQDRRRCVALQTPIIAGEMSTLQPNSREVPLVSEFIARSSLSELLVDDILSDLGSYTSHAPWSHVRFLARVRAAEKSLDRHRRFESLVAEHGR